MGAQDSDKYVAIADLAEQFTAAGVLVPLVKTEVDKMRQRLSNLSKRVCCFMVNLHPSSGLDVNCGYRCRNCSRSMRQMGQILAPVRSIAATSLVIPRFSTV